MITSADNPRLRLVRRLQSRAQRSRLGLFVCEGEDLVVAALDAGLVPVHALLDAERPAALAGLHGAELVTPRLLASVSTLAHPPRVVAVFRRADLARLDPADAPAAGLALWHVSDPANVGALVRSADALGPAFVALSAGCADPTGAKALRSSMGSVFRVPLGRFDEAPRPWIALVARSGAALDELELEERATFVLGAEREGLPTEAIDRCDAIASIAIAPHVDSLNVAVSGAIALYERRRQLRRSGPERP